MVDVESGACDMSHVYSSAALPELARRHCSIKIKVILLQYLKGITKITSFLSKALIN